jgi:DNA-directed RNA polymerase specialized sigma subunit
MSTRKQLELDLWKKWKYNRDPLALEDLLRSLRPIVKRGASPFLRSGLPQSVLEAEVKRIIIEALDAYDPSAYGDVQLSTFIISRIKKVNRLVYQHQNIGRISEQRITQVGTFNNVKSFLTDKHEREPTASELADELSWSIPEVERMERETRKDLISSVQQFEPGVIISDRDQEILELIYYELTQEEKLVYEYLLGKNGKPMLKPTQIAQRAGLSPAKVSRLRSSIMEKFQRYSGGR